jgi:hypothetical protein
MEKIVHKAHSFMEAEKREIEQYRAMTPARRQEIARALRAHYFGDNKPDIRDSLRNKRG